MKVRLIVEVSDDQRRALTGTRKLATRDDVRLYVEGALARLVDVFPPPPPSSRPVPPSTPTYSKALKERVEELKAKGVGEEDIQMYIRGWSMFDQQH